MDTSKRKVFAKAAPADYPVHDLIRNRWSPYAFGDRTVSADDLRSLFEAARWAASCYNDQPWYYIVARREQPGEFAKMLSCLVEGNQKWAQYAPVLALGLARNNFAHDGKANRHALHDLGQASANLSCEATARGLQVHQMAGILPDKARELYGIPDDVEVVTALAIGYADDSDTAPETLRAKDKSRRGRRPINETVFENAWGKVHSVFKGE